MKKLILLSALLIFACSSDDEGNPCIYEPTLSTEAVTDITETSATLNGVISIVSENCDVALGEMQGFVYSTNPSPTNDDNVEVVYGTDISTTIDNLLPNTTYYVRVFITNNLGEFYANEISFTTNEDICTVEEVDDLHTDVDCYASNNGSFTIEISDCNTAPYDIVLIDSNGTNLLQEQFLNNIYTVSDLASGEYYITIQDEGENLYTINITISEPSPIEVVVEINVNAVTINVSGGIPPYYIESSNGGPFVNGNTLNNLSDGIYTVVVSDSNGCSQVVIFEI